jgi:phosphoglycolate phosphatase-like HAD superfamily hydrolase
MLTMPAHADVKEGLEQLKGAGFRMVTLTNSPPNKGGKTPLENAGLAGFFERQLSVEGGGPRLQARRSSTPWWPRNWRCPPPPAA